MDSVSVNPRGDREAGRGPAARAGVARRCSVRCPQRILEMQKLCSETTQATAPRNDRITNKNKRQSKSQNQNGAGNYKDRGLRVYQRHSNWRAGESRRLRGLALLSSIRFAGVFCVVAWRK